MDHFSQSLLIITLLVTGLLLLTLWRNRQTGRKQHQRYRDGIAWLQLLRVLLTKTQQHRGLSNGYLHGDSSAQSKIAQLQREISQQSNQLEVHGSWLIQTERWGSIKDHWQRLSANYMNHQPSYSLEQHNKLILNILHLIEDCAEQHHLQELSLQGDESVEHLWKSLLFNAEFIGQARAVGTGVTAAKRCNSVERIRLKYLHSKLTEFKQTARNVASSSALAPLLLSIEQDVILNEPNISSSDYFSMATQALDSVMEEFDQGLSDLKQTLLC